MLQRLIGLSIVVIHRFIQITTTTTTTTTDYYDYDSAMFVCFSRVIAAIFAVNGEVNECPVLASLTGDVDTIIQIIEEIGADDKVMFKVVIDDSDAYKPGFSLKFLVHGLDLQVLSWMHA